MKARNHSNLDGANNLGRLYAEGKGVSKDLKMAREYFASAAFHGHAEAIKNLDALPKEK